MPDEDEDRPNLTLAASNGEPLDARGLGYRPSDENEGQLIAALADVLSAGSHGDPAVEERAEVLARGIIAGTSRLLTKQHLGGSD